MLQSRIVDTCSVLAFADLFVLLGIEVVGCVDKFECHERRKFLVITGPSVLSFILKEEVTVTASLEGRQNDVRVPLKVLNRHEFEICD